MKFHSPTDQPLHVALTTGHTCVIPPKGVELETRFHKEALARGAVPGSLVGEEKTAENPGFDKNAVIAAAMKAMLDGNDEDDFTNDGKPDMRKLKARVGFNLSREEADVVWAEVSKAPAAE